MTLKENIQDILLKVFVGLMSFTIFYYKGGNESYHYVQCYYDGIIGALIGYIVGTFLCNHFKDYFNQEISEEEL